MEPILVKEVLAKEIMTRSQFQKEFVRRLGFLVDESELTHQELSTLLGLKSHTAIGSWLKGWSFPKAYHIRKMVVVFNTTAEYLMCTGGEEYIS